MLGPDWVSTRCPRHEEGTHDGHDRDDEGLRLRGTLQGRGRRPPHEGSDAREAPGPLQPGGGATPAREPAAARRGGGVTDRASPDPRPARGAHGARTTRRSTRTRVDGCSSCSRSAAASTRSSAGCATTGRPGTRARARPPDPARPPSFARVAAAALGATVGTMDFAPTELDFIADPYPVYAELRERAPVRYDEATDHWLISRYEDVNALLRDRRFGRTYRHLATHAEMGHPDPPEWHAPFWDLINAGILDMEPPEPHEGAAARLEGVHPAVRRGAAAARAGDHGRPRRRARRRGRVRPAAGSPSRSRSR